MEQAIPELGLAPEHAHGVLTVVMKYKADVDFLIGNDAAGAGAGAGAGVGAPAGTAMSDVV